MDQHPIQAAADFLSSYGRYYLIGHKEPDGDCVASQLALAHWLRRLGKDAVPVSAGPFTRVEIAPYAGQFLDRVPKEPGADAACVVLDCSSISRTGSVAETIPPELPLAFIDHHAAGESTGHVVCIDPSAPAVAYLVQLVMEASGTRPDKTEAELLLFGLCTDTGFFRHLDARSSGVFQAVARLVDAGASPKLAFETMNGGKSFESRKLMGLLLSRAERHYDGRLISTWLGAEDMERFGQVSRDSDMLYQLFMSVAGVEAAVVVRQESAEECSVGFRSRDRIDVASIAASFGGGGHRLAAGLHTRGQALELKDRIVSAFSAAFEPGH